MNHYQEPGISEIALNNSDLPFLASRPGSAFIAVLRSNLPIVALLTFLLVLLCQRVWGLGVMHTDDAMWALRAHLPQIDTVADWTRDQGRLWALVSGTMMLHVLKWQGSTYGELLRLGGFALFFLAFHLMAAAYCGRRIALLGATLFLALFALKWDGSLLTTYPLLTWVAGIAFTGAVLAGRRHARTGGHGMLVLAGALLFFALFNNEGVTLAFIMLYPVTIWANAVQVDSAAHGLAVGRFPRRSWRLFLVFCASAAAYSVLYFWWRQLHPSIYPGHTVAPFDPVRIARTLYHFSTSGSVLHEMLAPLRVTYVDAIGGQARQFTYGLVQYADGLLRAGAAPLAGVVVAVLLWMLLEPRDETAPAARSVAPAPRMALALGLLVALVPILPVALMATYQEWEAERNVRAYSHTIFAHFGWSLALAGVLCAVAARLRGRAYYRALLLALCLGGGMLAALANRANDAIADDMRPEAGRWALLERTIAVNRAVFQADTFWTPALASGSWYTVVFRNYWTEFAKARHGATITVSHEIPDINDQLRGFVMHDYSYDRQARSLVSLYTRYRRQAGGGYGRADRIAVDLASADAQALRAYVLSYRDAAGVARRIPVATLDPVPGQPGLRVASGMQADPGTVRLLRVAADGAEAEVCVNRIPRGTRIDFRQRARQPGTVVVDAGAMLTAGWNQLEREGVWSAAGGSHIVIPAGLLPAGRLRAVFDFGTYASIGFRIGTQKVSASVGGAPMAQWSFTTFKPVPATEFELPATPAGAADVHIRLDVDPAMNPKALGIDPHDGRDLGLYLRSVTFEPLP